MNIANRSECQLQSLKISDARSLSYYQAGAGIPLVLLHGIGSSGASWVTQLQTLADGFQVVAWNAPGYGESDPIGHSNPIPKDYAQALDEFTTGLGLTEFYLVGHSLGALIAGAYSRLWPGKMRGLILIDPALGYGRASKEMRADKLASRIETFNRLGAKGVAETRGPKLLSSRAPEEAVELVCRVMAQLNAEGYFQASQMLANGDLLSDVEPYEGQALVLCGSEDQITPPSGAKEVAAVMKNAVYRDIAGAGHASYIEAPAQFEHYLTDFIASTESEQV